VGPSAPGEISGPNERSRLCRGCVQSIVFGRAALPLTNRMRKCAKRKHANETQMGRLINEDVVCFGALRSGLICCGVGELSMDSQELFAKVLSLCGLSPIIGVGAIRRSLNDIGVEPESATINDYCNALPRLEVRLRAFMPEPEVALKRRQILRLREATQSGHEFEPSSRPSLAGDPSRQSIPGENSSRHSIPGEPTSRPGSSSEATSRQGIPGDGTSPVSSPPRSRPRGPGAKG
jgi:hypothetical protein